MPFCKWTRPASGEARRPFCQDGVLLLGLLVEGRIEKYFQRNVLVECAYGYLERLHLLRRVDDLHRVGGEFRRRRLQRRDDRVGVDQALAERRLDAGAAFLGSLWMR